MLRIPLRTAFEATLSFGICLVFAAVTAAPIHAQTDAGQGTPDRAHIEAVLRDLNRGRGSGRWPSLPMEASWRGSTAAVAAAKSAWLRRVTLPRASVVTAATKADQHCREGELVWAPDSKNLAFFSDCAGSADHQMDLYVSKLDRESGEASDGTQGTSTRSRRFLRMAARSHSSMSKAQRGPPGAWPP